MHLIVCPLLFIICFVCVHTCSGQGWAFGGTREHRWVCMCAFMWQPDFLCMVFWEPGPSLFEKGLFLGPGACLLGWISIRMDPLASTTFNIRITSMSYTAQLFTGSPGPQACGTSTSELSQSGMSLQLRFWLLSLRFSSLLLYPPYRPSSLFQSYFSSKWNPEAR